MALLKKKSGNHMEELKNRLESFTGVFLITENIFQIFYIVKIILNKITTISTALEN